MKLLQLNIWHSYKTQQMRDLTELVRHLSPTVRDSSLRLSDCKLCFLTVNHGPTSLRRFFTIIVGGLFLKKSFL